MFRADVNQWTVHLELLNFFNNVFPGVIIVYFAGKYSPFCHLLPAYYFEKFLFI